MAHIVPCELCGEAFIPEGHPGHGCINVLCKNSYLEKWAAKNPNWWLKYIIDEPNDSCREDGCEEESRPARPHPMPSLLDKSPSSPTDVVPGGMGVGKGHCGSGKASTAGAVIVENATQIANTENTPNEGHSSMDKEAHLRGKPQGERASGDRSVDGGADSGDGGTKGNGPHEDARSRKAARSPRRGQCKDTWAKRPRHSTDVLLEVLHLPAEVMSEPSTMGTLNLGQRTAPAEGPNTAAAAATSLTERHSDMNKGENGNGGSSDASGRGEFSEAFSTAGFSEN